jgi:CRISPR-associated protein Csd1
MILGALVDYYNRKSALSTNALAPPGFERKEIPFVLVLNERGELVEVEDTREGEGKSKRARAFQVPQAVKKAAAIRSNLLWDTAEYVLGVDLRGNPERAQRQHAAFLQRQREVFGSRPSDPGLVAVYAFLDGFELARISGFGAWKDIAETNALLTFRLAGDTLALAERPSVRAVIEQNPSSAPEGSCLVTGEKDQIARLHPAIKGVRGSQSAGANIVSFNLGAFASYRKEQGQNSPVGERAVFRYSTALNNLLGKDSRQKLQVGDSTVVFWSERESGSSAETCFRDWFDPPEDDPDRGRESVRALFEMKRGKPLTGDDQQRFFVLGLAPNAARIAIRFWQVSTVQEIGERMFRHFEDLAIARGPKDPEFPPMLGLLRAIAAQGKLENIPPNLAGEWMRTVLTGAPYPATLLQAAIRRAKAEQSIGHRRAALIKACLNRSAIHDKEALTVALDPDNTNPAYRLGRLFAVLERIQEEANPGLNATIRDRYYGAASSNPRTVFPILNRMKNHHLGKLENRGRAVNLERLIGEIAEALESDDPFPASFSLADQGRFAVGYYHQRQHSSTYKSGGTN